MTEAEPEVPPEHLYAAMAMLAVFSIVGVIGNALVLYVFSNFKQKLTSTIFILTLAGTDFITCLVTIPYTITVELLNYSLHYDILCQFYQFLITTTIPFSAFVMVAIAVDRYLCICHPFKHAMTLKRAQVIVAFLCLFAVILGVLSSVTYVTLDLQTPVNISVNVTSVRNFTTSDNRTFLVNTTELTNVTTLVIYQYGVCMPKSIDTPFFVVFQKIYSSFFAVCCVIVMVLYAMIYRSVLARRRQRLKVTNKCCGFWTAIPSGNEMDSTEITTLNNEPTVEIKHDEKSEKGNVQKNGTQHQSSEKDTILRPGGVSRAKLEKMKLANIKTAFMLSIVTLVFIVAFLPSWLVALRLIPMNVIVFYMYFSYNVANPVIYAFMNNAFKTKLRDLFGCKSVKK